MRLVLERLALHDVAPVAGRVADRQEDRAVVRLRAGQRLRAPRVPVDRVVRVLEQVGAGLLGQAIGHARMVPARRAGAPESVAIRVRYVPMTYGSGLAIGCTIDRSTEGVPQHRETGVRNATTIKSDRRGGGGRVRHVRHAWLVRRGPGCSGCRLPDPQGRHRRRPGRRGDGSVSRPGTRRGGGRETLHRRRHGAVLPERDLAGRACRAPGRQRRHLHGPRERLAEPVPGLALSGHPERLRTQPERRRE